VKENLPEAQKSRRKTKASLNSGKVLRTLSGLRGSKQRKKLQPRKKGQRIRKKSVVRAEKKFTVQDGGGLV
jgi:hypothetical protein